MRSTVVAFFPCTFNESCTCNAVIRSARVGAEANRLNVLLMQCCRNWHTYPVKVHHYMVADHKVDREQVKKFTRFILKRQRYSRFSADTKWS